MAEHIVTIEADNGRFIGKIDSFRKEIDMDEYFSGVERSASCDLQTIEHIFEIDGELYEVD